MRLEEICQLHTNDVYEIEGVWVFDINTKPSKDTETTKEVKNKNAVRLVPIHPELLTVGLLDYVKTIRTAGQERIFPALNKTEKSPRYGKQVGKQFTDVIKYCGIEGKKSFHSLRHTFSDFFKQNQLQSDIFRQVYGHELPELAAKQYGSKFGPKKCAEEVIYKLKYSFVLKDILM